MNELTELCKTCMGCNKLENPNFKGVEQCNYHTLEQMQISGLDRCKKIIEQMKMEEIDECNK